MIWQRAIHSLASMNWYSFLYIIVSYKQKKNLNVDF